jgi:hypothetical protein
MEYQTHLTDIFNTWVLAKGDYLPGMNQEDKPDLGMQ